MPRDMELITFHHTNIVIKGQLVVHCAAAVRRRRNVGERFEEIDNATSSKIVTQYVQFRLIAAFIVYEI